MKKWSVILTMTLFMLIGCDSKNANTAEKDATVANKTKEVAKEITKTTKEIAENTADSVKEKVAKPAKKAIEETVDATKKVAKDVENIAKEKVIEPAKEAIEKNVVEPTKKMVDEINKSVTTSKENTNANITKVATNDAGKVLFSPCISCHGSKGEKKAMNKSQVIAGWDKEKTIKALKGYKDGSYGGAMKGLMKGQVTKLSDKQIEQLATFISSL